MYLKRKHAWTWRFNEQKLGLVLKPLESLASSSCFFLPSLLLAHAKLLFAITVNLLINSQLNS